jgi:hypothetical protein
MDIIAAPFFSYLAIKTVAALNKQSLTIPVVQE